MVELRQNHDLVNQCLFPRNEEMNMMSTLESWEVGNCAETNPLTHLASMDTRSAQIHFGAYGSRGITLRKLPELQYSQDIPSLRRILTSIYSFNETSSNVFRNYEIDDFFKVYGIFYARPIFASDDNYVFWFEDTAGAIYIWSRIDSSMMYIGQDLREALVPPG